MGKWKRRSFWLELPSKQRDSTTWSTSWRRPSEPRVDRTSLLTRETSSPSDSRTSSVPREAPSVPSALSSKTQSTKSSVTPSAAKEEDRGRALHAVHAHCHYRQRPMLEPRR